jgi:hypothetical protein
MHETFEDASAGKVRLRAEKITQKEIWLSYSQEIRVFFHESGHAKSGYTRIAGDY